MCIVLSEIFFRLLCCRSVEQDHHHVPGVSISLRLWQRSLNRAKSCVTAREIDLDFDSTAASDPRVAIQRVLQIIRLKRLVSSVGSEHRQSSCTQHNSRDGGEIDEVLQPAGEQRPPWTKTTNSTAYSGNVIPNLNSRTTHQILHYLLSIHYLPGLLQEAVVAPMRPKLAKMRTEWTLLALARMVVSK